MMETARSARAFAAMGVLFSFAVVVGTTLYLILASPDNEALAYAVFIASVLYLSSMWLKLAEVYAMLIPSVFDRYFTSATVDELSDEEREAIMTVYNQEGDYEPPQEEVLFEGMEPWDLPKEWLDQENERNKN